MGVRRRSLVGAAALLAPLALLVVPMAAAGAGASAEETLARLRAVNANLVDLQASFVHTKEVPLFDEKIVSSGELFFRSPDRLLLRYAEPDSNLVVIGEGEVWLYYPGLKQAHRYDIDPESTLPGLFLALRGTIAGLDRNFDVTGEDDVDSSGAALDVLVLKPKSGTALADELREIRVAVRSDDALPVRTEFWERSGDHTSFIFTRFTRNPSVDATLFEFQPPEGTEVFEVEGEKW
ncbi:MAG: outer membrane lipoprotein carrier protein LolA [Candidatus Latescibacterota bacterium]|nr:MAG: outer membrane lipoprotein carrier protein LolA [Candidatus Latescibacterota bacterium]